MKQKSKLISIFLIIAMVFTMLPMQVFAQELNKSFPEPQFNEEPPKPEAKILKEVAEKREKNVKHFFKEDGTYEAVVYPSAVHFLDEGKWKDIDNTLLDGTDEENNPVLENKENSYKVKIAKTTQARNLVKLRKGNYELSWNIQRGLDSPQNSLANIVPIDSESNNLSGNEKIKSLTKLNSTVEFKNIYPDVDLQYIVKPEQLKENIIINQNTDAEFSFNLYTKGLTAELLEDNTVVFYDESDPSGEIFKMDAPYMFDENLEESRDIKVTLDKTKDGYILSLVPSREWLDSPDRSYPVIIDPVVETSTGIKTIEDAHVSSSNPDTNYYQDMYLKIGYGSTIGKTRSYIRFTLPELRSAEMVTGAYSSLIPDMNYVHGIQVNAHKVTGSWSSSSVTWNNQPSYDSRVEDYKITTGSSENLWDVTSIVKEWYNTGENTGLMLKVEDETGGNGTPEHFASSDNGDSTIRPLATIAYVNNSGLEGYWTYHSQSVGRAGTGHVNDYTGNLVFVHNDLSMNGNKMPVTINHVYNSNDKDTDIGYGYGWRLNLSQRIKWEKIGTTEYYVYTDGDGTKHYLKWNSSMNAWVDEAGTNLTMTISGSGTSSLYTIKDKDDNKLVFVYSTHLKYIEDRNGNKITLNYDADNNLTSVVDGAGRTTTFTLSTSGRLTGITDPSGRKTSFGYNYGRLTIITYPDANKSNYAYDPNNNLTSATNYDGYKMTYSYYDTLTSGNVQAYRVKKVEEGHTDGTLGQELNISYGRNTTTYADYEGRKNIYQFNNSGNTISIKDADNRAEYYKFLDGANSNKLGLQSKLQKTVINLLKNHNAEANSDWDGTNWRDSTGSTSYTSEAKYIGEQSLKVGKTNTISRHFYSQSLTLEKGKTYTFSAYVKTDGISNINGKGAALFFSYQDETGTWQHIESDYISGTNEWKRVEVKFTLPSNSASSSIYARVGIIEETGTAYFDALQLEEGSIANRYNLVENPSLEYGSGTPAFWNRNTAANDAGDTIVDTSALPEDDPDKAIFGDKYFKIDGVYNKNKNLNQNINVSGKKGDAFVIGGWAKGESVPLSSGRKFALYFAIRKTDGTSQWKLVSFNEDSSDWQYASDVVIADEDYSSVTIYALYYSNENTAYFDGFQLYREQFGQSYTYDDEGNVISVGDLRDKESKFEYDANNDLIKAVDPKGSQFDYEYDTKHNMTKATSAENVVYSFTYDSSGNPLTAKVEGGGLFLESKTQYTDSGNYISKVTDASGNSVTYNYDETKGTLDSVKDPKDKVTSYGYDANDRLTSVSKAVGNETITNSYSYENDRIKSITHNGFSYNFGYDSLGNNTTVSVGDKNLITNNYEDRTSNLLDSTYGNNQKVGYLYDVLDRVVSKSYNGAVRYKYGYDAAGNLGYQEDLVNGINYRYIYDLTDRLARVEDSKRNVSSFEYDLNNNIIKTTDKIGSEVTSGYNLALNRPAVSSSNETTNLTPEKAFDGSHLTRWASQYSDPEWIYVDLGSQMNIKRVVLNWETAYGKAYDIQVSDDASNWTTIYSTENGDGGVDDINLASEARGRYVRMYGRARGYTAGYSLWDFEVYNDSPAITRYDYDKDNRAKNVWINGGGSVSYSYDGIGRLKSKTINTGSSQYVTSYEYEAGSAAGSTTNRLSKYTNNGVSLSYEYDSNGNISKVTASDGKTIEYIYDELNELKRENNGISGITTVYTYDKGGNILSKAEYPYTTGTVGTATRVYNYSYEDAVWKDFLTKFGGKAISYDAIGNPTSYDGWTFAWEEGRQLKSVTGNGKSISFKYNDDGIRTEKTVNGTTTNYHLVGDKVTFETNGTDKIYYSYGSAGDLVSMNLNGVEYYYIRNGQGDIIGLFDGSGTQVVWYNYDSWGKLLGITDNSQDVAGEKNPYRYRGYRYDRETQLYYLQSRYYNPEWGRFINADKKSGTLGELLSHNLFAYCMNNPVNMVDPYGYDGGLISGVVGGIVIGTGGTAILVVVGVLALAGLGAAVYYSYPHVPSETITQTASENDATPQVESVSQVFPDNPSEMDKVLNVPGQKVKDGPTTKGRNKVKWKVSDDISVTHEQHPYHRTAPAEHSGPHYHVEAPTRGYDHIRFLPGDPLPDIFK